MERSVHFGSAIAIVCAAHLAIAAPAAAHDSGCAWRDSAARVEACAESRFVPVREAYAVPAVVEPRPYAVVVAPSRLRSIYVPASYGSVSRSRLIAPAQVRYVAVPAVVEHRSDVVMTHAGGVQTVRTIGRDGRERICRTGIPARYRRVERDVVVRPAGRVAVMTPAIYRDVEVPVVINPAHVRHVLEPAETIVEYRPTVLRPAEIHVVGGVGQVAWPARRVIDSPTGYVWQPRR